MIKLKQFRKINAVFTKNTLVLLIGILGYMFFLTAWVLCIALLVNLAISSGSDSISVAVDDASMVTQANENEQNVVTQILGYAVTGFIIAITAVLIIVLPYYIAKYLSAGIKLLMQLLKVDQTLKQLFTVKLLLSLIPLVIFMTVFVFNPYITVTDIALYIATIVLLVLSTICFAVQTFLAKKCMRTYNDIF